MILPRNDVEIIDSAKLSQNVRDAESFSAGNALPSMKTVFFAPPVYVKRIDLKRYSDYGAFSLKDSQGLFNSLSAA